MKINEIAKITELPISTIRYYEKMGIVPDEYIVRDENNYRNYKLGVIEHLNVVKTCLTVGFTINEVKSMILMESITKEAQTLLLKEKILELEDAKRKLQQSKQYLQTMLESDVSCEQGFGKTNLS